MVNVKLHTKFGANWQRSGRDDRTVCVFARWRPCAALDLLFSNFGPHTKSHTFIYTYIYVCPIHTGCMFHADGVIIRFDVNDALQFYIFGNLAGKWLFTPLLGSFWCATGGKGGLMCTPTNSFSLFGFFTCMSLFVKIDQEIRP